MNKLAVVVKEVYLRNVKTWSFVLMVLAPIISFMFFAGINYYLNHTMNEQAEVQLAILDLDHQLADRQVQAVLDNPEDANDYTYNEYQSVDQAGLALKDSKIDGIMVVENVDPLQFNYYSRRTDKEADFSALEKILQEDTQKQLGATYNLNPGQMKRLLHPKVDIHHERIHLGEDGQVEVMDKSMVYEGIRLVVASVVNFILFFFIIMNVSMIAQEVANEKGSRLMEIILSSIPARTHFMGKILGILAVILTQFAAYIAIFSLIRPIMSLTPMMEGFNFDDISLGNSGFSLGEINLWEIVGPIIFWGIIFLLLGFFIYTGLAALLGSLVTRQEDVQKVLLPIMFPCIIGFYIGVYGVMSPNHALVQWSSFIPLLTPLIMPFRIATQTVSQSMVYLAVVLCLLLCVVVYYLGIRFYESNMLTTSDLGIWQSIKRSYQLQKSEKDLQE